LFRIAGSTQRIKYLQSIIEENGKIHSFDGFTAHDVAGVFKLFFRLLPEPESKYFYKAVFRLTISHRVFIGCVDEKLRFQLLQLLCWMLPSSHRILLEHTLDFLALIAYHSYTSMDTLGTDGLGNLMDSKNLAVCIGPTLMHDDQAMIADQERGIEENQMIAHILQTLINHHRRLWILPSKYVNDMVNILGNTFLQSPNSSKRA
jgi:hypothetical protein